MVDFILRVYTKIQITVKNIQMLYKIYKFSIYLYQDRIFHNGYPLDVLKVLKKFIELACSEYCTTLVMNRNPNQSSELLSTLIERYYNTGSNTTLEQILEVLKNEFIKRENNGRKQF